MSNELHISLSSSNFTQKLKTLTYGNPILPMILYKLKKSIKGYFFGEEKDNQKAVTKGRAKKKLIIKKK